MALVPLAEECRYNNDDMDQMVDIFVDLARDPVWSVRKTCADCLADFSKKTKAETRTGPSLALLYELLEDENKWVKKAAQANLGKFMTQMPLGTISDQLVGHYRGMLDDPMGLAGDNELPCAFCFPAVAHQLGAERWSEINTVFEALRDSEKWEV